MIRALLLTGIIALCVTVNARAQEQRTIRGEVVGLSCYTDPVNPVSSSDRDARTSCSLSALKSGEPAGVIDQKTGKLYIAISGDGTKVSDKLLPNVAKLVDVTGAVQEKSGVSTIAVSRVRPVENAPSEAGTPPMNATGNGTGLPSGSLGSGEGAAPAVPWGSEGATNRNDTLYNVTRAPGVHDASPREIPGVPGRGTRYGEVYMNEGENNATDR